MYTCKFLTFFLITFLQTAWPPPRWLSDWSRGPKSASWQGETNHGFIFTQQYYRVAAETAKLSSVLTLTQVGKSLKKLWKTLDSGWTSLPHSRFLQGNPVWAKHPACSWNSFSPKILQNYGTCSAIGQGLSENEWSWLKLSVICMYDFVRKLHTADCNGFRYKSFNQYYTGSLLKKEY